MGILSFLIFLPFVGMLFSAFLPKSFGHYHKWITLSITFVQLAIFVVAAIPQYNQAIATGNLGINKGNGFIFMEKLPWILADLGNSGKLQIDFFVAMDGLSFPLILLTLIIMVIATVSAWRTTKRAKAFFMLLLLLDSSLLGCFLALDFFLFYLFYELMLLPMFFLIGMWGGERKEYAAIKFFLYTLVGSVFLLLIMVGLAFSFTTPNHSDIHTFNLITMMQTNAEGALQYVVKGGLFDKGSLLFGGNARLVGFLIAFIAFAIKVPVFPLHTWLPDAHVEAPTSISVILAGVLLKVGVYGILRICVGVFPEGLIYFAWWIGLFGLISMIYGALVAMAQKDLKALVAYSSISHLGYTLLGIASLTSAGMNGAVLQLFNHGLTSAMLFLLVGVLYDRVHSRQIAQFSGLWGKMPHYTLFVIVAFFASLGLPGFNTFVSELLVFMGAFQAGVAGQLPIWMAFVGVISIVLGAVYFLRTFRTMFFGVFSSQTHSDWNHKLHDLTTREYFMLIPLALLILLFGIFPNLMLTKIEGSMNVLVNYVLAVGKSLL